ncbi:hypothetical protein ATANTOWER_022758, partial [Ataeniobius toweri]|nr:hypothetical protein [Ataeniobius toweri]
VTKLQSDIAPLHNSLSILSEKNGSLQADKRLLEDDLKRWKAKVQHLVSQQKEGDAEEKQKVSAEKEAQQKRITQLAEETAKLKTELVRSNASSNSAQSQLQGLKDSVVRLTSEKDNLKKELEAKNNDILEKSRTITQVKKIGRRYKTQYEELKAQHDKLVSENSGNEEQKKTQEELNTLKEEIQKKLEEAQKSQQELEAAQKENQQTKEKLQDLQTQLTQNQNQLTQVQSQLSQTQNQLQQNQSQLALNQKELEQAQTQTQQLQTKLKSVQCLAQARQNQMQQMQKELQQAKETLQQNLAKQKELQQTNQATQQSHNQEVNEFKTALSQTENKVTELQGQLDSLRKTVSEREAEVKLLKEQVTEAKQAYEASQAAQANQSSQSTQASDSTAAGDVSQALQDELTKLREELSESKNKEEQLKQQMAEKEEKTKKAILGAKLKISQVNSAKEQLSQENEELKQSKEELEVRMNALKSQYEGRLLRLDRELRELRETQAHSDGREEALDQSGAKLGDQPRSLDQRQMSLKCPAQDRGSLSTSEPPTANIRPTPSTPSPSNKPSPSTGSKATPRASIRPMVTPATVPIATPTATVMPTTQTESQEALISTGASVHSTSSALMNTSTSLTQPTSTQATAFVQPTQQQAASQEAGSSMEAEHPSTSSSSSPCMPATGSKRSRENEEEEEESRPESSQTPPSTKKLRLKPTIALQMEGDEELDGELRDVGDQQVSPDDSQELPEEGFQVLAVDMDEEDEGVSQSVPSDQGSQGLAFIRDVIVIDTDSESRESKDWDQRVEEEEEEEEEDEEEEAAGEREEENEDDDDDDAADSGMRGGEEHNEESQEALEEREEENTSEGANTEENVSEAPTSSQHPSDPSQSGEGTRGGTDLGASKDSLHHPTTCSTTHSPSSSSLTPRLPQTRRPPHVLPPRLYIQAPAPELGPPHTQRQSSQLRRPSSGRGPQLTPGLASMPFFDDDDRMVPSTPTLVVPHRTDGFAEAIHSPQVAGLSTRFRFGPPEDLLQQTPASHSDLGQLASQGGLGMYESPLFLAAHDEDGGGRSVPTTPLQVAAPVTVFTESMPSDSGDNMASQSVPMVTASTGMAAAADDGDEVFMEQEGEGPGIETSLDSQTDLESTGQQSDDASLPSTSQDPDTSSVSQPRSVTSQPLMSILLGRGRAGRFLSRRGTFPRGGRGGAAGKGGVA